MILVKTKTKINGKLILKLKWFHKHYIKTETKMIYNTLMIKFIFYFSPLPMLPMSHWSSTPVHRPGAAAGGGWSRVWLYCVQENIMHGT